MGYKERQNFLVMYFLRVSKERKDLILNQVLVRAKIVRKNKISWNAVVMLMSANCDGDDATRRRTFVGKNG